MDDISKKNEIVQAMTTVEYHLALPEQTPNLSGYTKLPFGMFASLGVGLASLPECFRTVATTAATSGEGLWRLSTMPGATGTLQMKNGVTLGNLVGEEAPLPAVPGLHEQAAKDKRIKIGRYIKK